MPTGGCVADRFPLYAPTLVIAVHERVESVQPLTASSTD